ncbi:hypothetical protein ACKKBG_A31805 [Auxenochlorella protothecoides x Auxenochlorella symbiontica]
MRIDLTAVFDMTSGLLNAQAHLSPDQREVCMKIVERLHEDFFPDRKAKLVDSVRASLEQTANLAVLVQAAESSREAVFIFSSDARLLKQTSVGRLKPAPQYATHCLHASSNDWFQARCELQALIPDLARKSARLLCLSSPSQTRSVATPLPHQPPRASLQLSVEPGDTVRAAIFLSDNTVDCQLARALHSVQSALTAARMRQGMWGRATAASRRRPRAVHAAHLAMQVTVPCRPLSRAIHAGSAAAAAADAARQARRAMQAELVQGVVAIHEQLHKAWLEARIRAQKERLAALRSNDMAAYVGLVAVAGSSQLDKLLCQTDACLRALTARLSSTRAVSSVGKGLEGPGTDCRSRGAVQESSADWNQLACRVLATEISEQPAGLIGGRLWPYQMQGLCWMAGLARHSLNGILADEMGLGKTVQVIALMMHLVEADAACLPFLIVVPASLVPNWQAELQRWAPGLKTVIYRGPAAERENIYNRQIQRGVRRPGTFHVVVTTYEILMGKLDRPRLSCIRWSHVIVDEGHRLKNAGCKLNAEIRQYKCDHRLLLTGTPLQNDISELWSLLNFLLPDLFNSCEDFQTWFGGAPRSTTHPPDQEGDESAALLTEEEQLVVTSRLHQVLRPFVLRRLKESVASQLPEKIEVLVRCPMSPYQQALTNIIAEGTRARPGGGIQGVAGVNNVVMELRTICNHPLLSRLHVPGSECELPASNLPAELRLCGKLAVLDRILGRLKAAGHRVLIFSTMTRALDVLEEYLNWRGYTWQRLDGNTGAQERGTEVAAFNAPGSSTFVFLLSVRAGGVGLNLQSADTVVMYDTDWNAQIDLQAQARVHRLGQTKKVLVIRLQTAGSVEERVVDVAQSKRTFVDRSITCGFFDGKTSAAERQRHLLEFIAASADSSGMAGTRDGGAEMTDEELNGLVARDEDDLAAMAGISAPASVLADAEGIGGMVAAAQDAATPKDPDAGREFGRGVRHRAAALAAKPLKKRPRREGQSNRVAHEQ